MASEDNLKDDLAPLNIMEYTFTEKMLFVDTTQLKKFAQTFPNIHKKDLKPFVLLTLKEMEGQTPRVGGVSNMTHYVAIRSLVHALYREASLADKHRPPFEEVYDYLVSLKLSADCSRELLNIIWNPEVFNKVPKAIGINPTIVSTRWMIDISYCQRNTDDVKNEDKETKIDFFRNHIRIILFLKLSDGAKKTYSLRWHQLAKLRLDVSEALRLIEEAEELLRLHDEKDKENLRIMRAEGHF